MTAGEITAILLEKRNSSIVYLPELGLKLPRAERVVLKDASLPPNTIANVQSQKTASSTVFDMRSSSMLIRV